MNKKISTHNEYINAKGWIQCYLLELHVKKNIWNKEKILEIYNLITKEGWLEDSYKVNFILSFMEADSRFKGINVSNLITAFNRFGEELYKERIRLERKKERERSKILHEKENCANLEDFI